jgi:hypothetical protein
MMETVVDIYQFSTGSKKSYSVTNEGITAWIVPASNEAIAMIDNMPQGQPFEFRVLSDDIETLKQQSKFVVVASQLSGFTDGDIFYTIADTKRQFISGRYYLVGMCYKAE